MIDWDESKAAAIISKLPADVYGHAFEFEKIDQVIELRVGNVNVARLNTVFTKAASPISSEPLGLVFSQSVSSFGLRQPPETLLKEFEAVCIKAAYKVYDNRHKYRNIGLL